MPLPSYVESKDEKVRETERVRQAVREIAAQREKVVQKMDELIEKTKVVTGRLNGGLRDI
jgi:hypothetical protein